MLRKCGIDRAKDFLNLRKVADLKGFQCTKK